MGALLGKAREGGNSGVKILYDWFEVSDVVRVILDPDPLILSLRDHSAG